MSNLLHVREVLWRPQEMSRAPQTSRGFFGIRAETKAMFPDFKFRLLSTDPGSQKSSKLLVFSDQEIYGSSLN